MYTRDIDKTHIIALQKVNGKLQSMEQPIERPEQFIAELKAMIENANRTAWDMQSLFETRFHKTSGYLDYINPYSYDSSYVGGIQYPDLLSYDELRRSWDEVGNAARESYLASCKQEGVEPDASVAIQTETKARDDLKRRQKNRFFNDAMRWIDANCYYETANRLNCNSSVKMYSKESIGWNSFTHRISDDIKIALKTNFGFGRAAYFLLAVQYKGLDILPYSYIVKYYKAGMADIVRCTRSYSPCRESWSASFDFLSDFANNSIADPEGFVKSYIIREVTEMMQGLEAIAFNPKSFIERIGARTGEPCVIHIRPMFNDDRVRMQSYPDETPILFKVEKIIGALDFLKSLTEIAQEVKSVQPHIDRLLELNMALYPEVQDAIGKINVKMEEQTTIKANLETRITALSEKLVPFEEEISRLRAQQTKDKPFVMSNYESKHAEYVKIRAQRSDVQSQLFKVNRLISDFNSFLNILKRSLSKLDEVKQIKEAA